MSVNEGVIKEALVNSPSVILQINNIDDTNRKEKAAISLVELGHSNVNQNLLRNSVVRSVYPPSPASENSATSTNSWSEYRNYGQSEKVVNYNDQIINSWEMKPDQNMNLDKEDEIKAENSFPVGKMSFESPDSGIKNS